MWPAAIIALFTAGPFGVVLFLAAGITQAIKVAKVDAEYAKQGKTPPSHALISKWLDSRAAKGAKPQKIAKPGMWRYAWQRWQAMWEDLGDRHKEVRGQYKIAVAHAKAKGELPPPKPTLKETLTGWKWHLDQLTPPTPATVTAPAGGTDTAGSGRQPRPSPHPRPASPAAPARPGMNWPTTGVCTNCRTSGNLTAVGWCEPCVTANEHGFCATCHGLMIRDGDVMRHGPDQDCDAVAPAANKVAPPNDEPTSTPPPGEHPNLVARPANVPPRLWDHASRRPPPCPECGAATQLQPGDPNYAQYHCPNCKRVTESWAWAGVAKAVGLCTWCGRHAPGQPCARSRPESVPTEPTPARPAGTSPTNPQGDTMAQPVQQSGEVTGTRSAAYYAQEVAKAHAVHAANEGYLGSLARMEVGDGDIGLVRAAMQKSMEAGEAWKAAGDSIDANNARVREAYSQAPDAANKTANINE